MKGENWGFLEIGFSERGENRGWGRRRGRGGRGFGIVIVAIGRLR